MVRRCGRRRRDSPATPWAVTRQQRRRAQPARSARLPCATPQRRRPSPAERGQRQRPSTAHAARGTWPAAAARSAAGRARRSSWPRCRHAAVGSPASGTRSPPLGRRPPRGSRPRRRRPPSGSKASHQDRSKESSGPPLMGAPAPHHQGHQGAVGASGCARASPRSSRRAVRDPPLASRGVAPVRPSDGPNARDVRAPAPAARAREPPALAPAHVARSLRRHRRVQKRSERAWRRAPPRGAPRAGG